jgi:hypothetical protein
MKTIWSIFSALAVGHLLAITGFGCWLVATERLDWDRAQAIREVMQETIPDQQAREQAEREQAEAEAEAARAAQAEAEDNGIPLMADGVVQAKIEASEMDQQRLNRMRRLVADLQETVRIEREALVRDCEAFEQQKADYEAERQRIAQIEGAEQFRTALTVYEGLRPAAAQNMLAELLAGAGEAKGSKDRGEELVVAYLNAMQERQRNKIMAEFEKEDPALAAGLLERLRTRGLPPGGGGGAEVFDAPGGP